MTYLDSILKRRDITLPTNVCLGKAMVFPVVMYRCESWAIKKDGIKELMLLNCGAGGLLRVPWTAGRSNQSIRKEINSEHSFKGLMLKRQFFGHLMQRADSLAKTLILGKIEGRRRRGRQRMRWLDGIAKLNGHEFEQTLEDSEGQENLLCYSPWGHKESNTTEWLNNNNLFSQYMKLALTHPLMNTA